MTEKFLRLKEVKKLTGLGRSTIYAEMERGRFPRNVPLIDGGTNAVAWLESEVSEWIQETIARARGAAA